MLMSLLILSAISAPADGVDFTPHIPDQPGAGSPPAASRPCHATFKQAVVVTTADWTTPEGILQRYDRFSPKDVWQPVGEAIPVVVGRNGLGWGIGLQGAANLEKPRYGGSEKREGDGRAPAGIFKLSSAFGYASAPQAAWIKLPYTAATSSLRCVDDPQSLHYNRLVDASQILPDWKSAEEMRRGDDQYRLGVVVDHNTDPVVSGRGSCIFIHIWKGAKTGTAGCTAMSQDNMELLLRWLDPAADPVLIQLPAPTYGQLRPVWGLP